MEHTLTMNDGTIVRFELDTDPETIMLGVMPPEDYSWLGVLDVIQHIE